MDPFKTGNSVIFVTVSELNNILRAEIPGILMKAKTLYKGHPYEHLPSPALFGFYNTYYPNINDCLYVPHPP